MDYLVTVVKLFIMAFGIALAVALVIMFGIYVLAMLGVILSIFALAWILDVKFTVTEGGKQTGYYKRSTGFVPNKTL
jgi:uncharacterized protein (DUF58 family)